MKLLAHSITILHTNDFHNGLKPQGAQKLAEEKSQQPNTLLLDAGDIIKTGNLGIPLAEEAIWNLMAQAGYDAVTMGNRETHVAELGLKAKLKGAPCPVLCANLIDKQNEQSPLVQPYIQFQRGQARIIVLGLTVPMVTAKMKTQALSRYLFRQPIETAQDYAPKLRSECDLLIALTHIGYKNDLKLAETVPLFDLIIGGHSHTILEQPEQVNNTLVLQTGSHGRFYGRLEIATSGEYKYRLSPLKESK